MSVYGYFASLICAVGNSVEVPVYWPPIMGFAQKEYSKGRVKEIIDVEVTLLALGCVGVFVGVFSQVSLFRPSIWIVRWLKYTNNFVMGLGKA